MWVEWVDRAGDGWDCWVSLEVKGRVVSREIHLKLGIKRTQNELVLNHLGKLSICAFFCVTESESMFMFHSIFILLC